MLSICAAMLFQASIHGRVLREPGVDAVFGYGDDAFALARFRTVGPGSVRIVDRMGKPLKELEVPEGFDVVGVKGKDLVLARNPRPTDLRLLSERGQRSVDFPFRAPDLWYQRGAWLTLTTVLQVRVGQTRLTASFDNWLDRFAVSGDGKELWVLRPRERRPCLDRYIFDQGDHPKTRRRLATKEGKAIDFGVPGHSSMTEWRPGQLVSVSRINGFSQAERQRAPRVRVGPGGQQNRLLELGVVRIEGRSGRCSLLSVLEVVMDGGDPDPPDRFPEHMSRIASTPDGSAIVLLVYGSVVILELRRTSAAGQMPLLITCIGRHRACRHSG